MRDKGKVVEGDFRCPETQPTHLVAGVAGFPRDGWGERNFREDARGVLPNLRDLFFRIFAVDSARLMLLMHNLEEKKS